MKKLIFVFSVFLYVFSVALFSKTADEWVADGDQALMNHDTLTAYQCYLNAYNLNNNHQGANFGLALLTLPHFLIDGGDTEVRNFTQKNGLSIVGNLYESVVSRWDVEQTSTIPEVQDFLNSHIIPYINQSLQYLNKIQSGFQKNLNKKMQFYEAYKEATIQTSPGDWKWNIRLTNSGNLIQKGWCDYLFLLSNIEVGVKWKSCEFFDEISTIESNTATVTTPAGTFTNCIEVVREETWENWDGEIVYRKMTEYFKKDVGLVKGIYYEETVDTEIVYSYTQETSLKSYSVAGTGYFPIQQGNYWTYEIKWWENGTQGQYSDETWAIVSIFTYDGSIYETDKEWDYGETQAAKSILNLVNGLLNIACAYNLDVSYDDLKNLNLKQLLDKYPAFLTIKTDGQTKLNNALNSFKSYLDSLIGSYDFIKDETDPQADDFLYFPDNEEFNYLKDDLRNLIVNWRNTLNDGGADFDPTDLLLKLTYYAYGSPVQFPKRIDLSKFFTNPITRTNLQPLQFDNDGDLVLSSLWNFDQTINGVFPDLTKNELVGYFKSSPYFEYRYPYIVDENSILLHGFVYNDINEIQSIKIYRDTEPRMSNKVLIATIYPEDLSGGEWGGDFEFLDDTASGDIYYYMAVIDFKDGSYSFFNIERAARNLYVDKNFSGTYKGTSDQPYKYIGTAVEYGNKGSTIYVRQGTYRLGDDPFISDDGIYIDENLRMVGSCDDSWQSNPTGPNTIIDAQNMLTGFSLGWGSAGSSIENFIIKNAEDFGIEVYNENNEIKNCVIHNNGNGWGAGIYIYGGNGSNINISNCTIANNYGSGIAGGGYDISIKNCIVANNSTGINLWNGWGLIFSYNDVWGNGTNYYGISDKTGINGNISLDPLFINPANGDYRLSKNSPCISAGENGFDIGAYKYTAQQKGDISNDGEVDISDVILCLRMAISIDEPNVEVADINDDGVVDISDVILILRKSVGLD
ncbi:MAG TPA: right-handed parallel beta-helix repeat-containing protein [bacterium]|nr:right-handed parallel beta-helix repeat-containing protein [bacterium]